MKETSAKAAEFEESAENQRSVDEQLFLNKVQELRETISVLSKSSVATRHELSRMDSWPLESPNLPIFEIASLQEKLRKEQQLFRKQLHSEREKVHAAEAQVAEIENFETHYSLVTLPLVKYYSLVKLPLVKFWSNSRCQRVCLMPRNIFSERSRSSKSAKFKISKNILFSKIFTDRKERWTRAVRKYENRFRRADWNPPKTIGKGCAGEALS